MSTLPGIVGKRLRGYRTRAGFSQEQLAERAGFHPTYVGQLERGEKNMTLESLERICAALGLSISQLFDGIGPAWSADSPAEQCRELMEALSPPAQKHALNIMRELSEIDHK